MVRRNKQKIISGFGNRKRNGKIEHHNGVDLRTWNLKIWKQQDIIFPENCKVIRVIDSDKWGGGIVCKPLESGLQELKFIHIKHNCKVDEIYNKGDFMGRSMTTNFMKQHHLHFETWRDNVPINPIRYFHAMGVSYG